jgi:hypothetical protein
MSNNNNRECRCGSGLPPMDGKCPACFALRHVNAERSRFGGTSNRECRHDQPYDRVTLRSANEGGLLRWCVECGSIKQGDNNWLNPERFSRDPCPICESVSRCACEGK